MRRVLVLMMITAPVLWDRIALAEGTTLDAWLARGTSALPASPAARTLTQAALASETAIRASLDEAPWSVASGLAHGQYLPRPDVNALPTARTLVPSWDARVSAEVRYQLRSRLLARLAASASLYQHPAVDTASAEVLPFSVEFSVAYDVLRGSRGSAEHERARAAAVRALGDKLSAEATLVDAELGYLSLLVGTYSNACKLSVLDELEQRVSKSLTEVKLQRDTRVISPVDYMNFEHLTNVVRVQRADLELERDALLEDLAAWGPEAQAAARALTGTKPACEPRVPEGGGVEAEVIARALPATGAARAELWASSLVSSATKIERRASLSPYVAGRVGRELGATDTVGTAELGLSLSWDVPGARGDALDAAVLEAKRAAELRVEQVTTEQAATVRRLATTLDRSRTLVAALQGTLDNSNKLEKALDVQRSIGDVNALNQTTAFVNGLSSKLAIVDAWLRAELAARQLAILRDAARQYAPELARLEDTAWIE
ncbi:hypothetical protein L6R52_23275 [Myxococcota bacterium]|nr:hypothetical protein [Myxococcota bacterium]